MNKYQITYAFFDIIGTRKLLSTSDGPEKFRKLWKIVDGWTSQIPNIDYLPLEGKNTKQIPEIHVIAFSDSFLLYTKPEFTIAAFYKIVSEFKKIIEKRGFSTYCIISRDEEILETDFPALGGFSVDDKNIPLFTQVAGIGPSWVNIYLAEKAIKKYEKWHGKYNLYCIGERSKSPDIKGEDSFETEGYNGEKIKIIALRQEGINE